MTLIQYFRSVFGGASVSIFETLSKIDALLSSIFDNLPNTIFIKDKSNRLGYLIDFTSDIKIGYDEYTALHAVFSQFISLSNPNYEVSCTYGKNNTEISFNELLAKFPGMYKIIKSVLFLDFHNSQEFINNSISLYELIKSPKFATLPSQDKRDSYISQLKEVQKSIERYTTEYDVLSVDYVKFSGDIDKLSHVLQRIETESILSKKEETPEPSDNSMLIHELQKESRRIAAVIEKLKNSIDLNNSKILEISKKNRITVTDSSRQKELTRINKRRQKIIDVLSGRQLSILKEIEQTAEKDFFIKSASSRDLETSAQIEEIKSSYRLAEERRRQVHNAMTEMKSKINALKLEAMDLEGKIKSEGAPVDINRISSENLLLLDTETTLHEKTVRFLLSYFNELDPRSFLTIPQRRDLLKKIFPELKMKSISLLPEIKDFENFIEVSA
jgi:hypothetical protein